MLLTIFQTGSIDKYIPIIISGSLLLVGFILLKLGLIIVKAEKRKRMKWVGYSYLIQIGIIFAIGSPLMLLGFAGDYRGEFGPIIIVTVVATFVDLNVINTIHQVGFGRSLVVVLLIIVPSVFALRYLGEFLATLQYL